MLTNILLFSCKITNENIGFPGPLFIPTRGVSEGQEQMGKRGGRRRRGRITASTPLTPFPTLPLSPHILCARIQARMGLCDGALTRRNTQTAVTNKKACHYTCLYFFFLILSFLSDFFLVGLSALLKGMFAACMQLCLAPLMIPLPLQFLLLFVLDEWDLPPRWAYAS